MPTHAPLLRLASLLAAIPFVLGGVAVGSAQAAEAHRSGLPEMHVTQGATLKGAPEVGVTMSFTGPKWDQPTDRRAVQWRLDGHPITGATHPRYTVRKGDLGHKLSVRVTGYRQGYYPSYADSYGRRITPATTRTSATLAASVIGLHSHAKIAARVRSALKGAGRTGTVEVLDQGRVVGEGRLSTQDAGRITLRCTVLSPGDHRLRVTYLGDQLTSGSHSPRLDVHVGP